jgi:hypothetical protein
MAVPFLSLFQIFIFHLLSKNHPILLEKEKPSKIFVRLHVIATYSLKMHFPAPAVLLVLGASSLASARAIDAWGKTVYTECKRWGMPQRCDKGRPIEDTAQPPFHYSMSAQPTSSLAPETVAVRTKTISIATTVTSVPMSSTTTSPSTTTTHPDEDLVKVVTLSPLPVPPRPITGLKYCDGGREGDHCTGDCNSLKEPGQYHVDAHCIETNGKVFFSVCDGSFNMWNWSLDGDCHYAADFSPAIRADCTHVYNTPGTHRIYFDPNPLDKWAKDIDWVDKMVIGREG